MKPFKTISWAEMGRLQLWRKGKSIARLAALPLVEYARVCHDEAKRLAIEPPLLDDLVAAARRDILSRKDPAFRKLRDED